MKETAPSEIGGDEEVALSVAEDRERLQPLRLRQVSYIDCHLHVTRCMSMRQSLHVVLDAHVHAHVRPPLRMRTPTEVHVLSPSRMYKCMRFPPRGRHARARQGDKDRTLSHARRQHRHSQRASDTLGVF